MMTDTCKQCQAELNDAFGTRCGVCAEFSAEDHKEDAVISELIAG